MAEAVANISRDLDSNGAEALVGAREDNGIIAPQLALQTAEEEVDVGRAAALPKEGRELLLEGAQRRASISRGGRPGC